MESQTNTQVVEIQDNKRKHEEIETSHVEYEYKTGNCVKRVRVLSNKVKEIDALSQSAKEFLLECNFFLSFIFLIDLFFFVFFNF